MKIWSLLLGWALVPLSAAVAEPVRVHESFDFGWRFVRGDVPGAEQPAFDDAAWRKLDLPHDWSIEGPFGETEPTGGPGGYLPAGVGWYRKHFQMPEALRGRKCFVQFDGVYMNSDVWLNGRHLGRWPYGYTTFQYDLTPHLNFGDTPNLIAVRVDNFQQPNSRWYSGSGIYRHTWITVTDPLRVAPWGVCVTTPAVTAAAATVRVRTQVLNDGPAGRAVVLTSEILDAAGAVVVSAQSEATMPAGAQEFDQTVQLPAPRLWSPVTPELYRMRTTLRGHGAPVDEVETTFGVRTIDFDVNRGFLLNSQPVKLLGVCLHHDGGAVGAAVPEAVLERRLRLLKEMGANAVRFSHNPMAPEMLDLCDRLGLLVMDEAFDEWTVRKPQIKFGYSDYFREWAERDLVALIRRDRNHPCVVLWSAGNEIGEQRAPTGPGVLRPLVEIFHREDPTRPVTAALDNIFTDRGPAPTAFTDLLDVVGYNYVDRWLDRRETFFGPDRSAFPGRKFVGTEDTGVGGARGVYEFRPLGSGTPARAVYATAMIRVEQLWKFALTHDYVTGHFMWTGIDYLGESRWPRKNAVSGVLDTCGFPKDGFYLYQSLFSAKPVLHLFPHWNWSGREGEVIPVLAYTNCDVVELFLNGRSLGAKAREFPRPGTKGGWNSYEKPPVLPTTADLHLAWDAPYAPGTLKAIGYKAGQVVCETEVRTAGAPAAIRLTADRTALRADARDVAHLTVEVVDAAGVVVPGAENLVQFAVQGAGRLIGVDNGDPASHEDYKASRRQAFAGRCLALVQTTVQAGEIRVTASADGLQGAAIVLRTTVPAGAPKPVVVPLE